MTTKHVTLRLAPDLHSWLVDAAARENRSVNGYIEWRLKQERERDGLRGKEVRHRDGGPRNNDLSNPEVRGSGR